MKTPIKTRLELTLCAMLPYELKGTIYYQEDNIEEITLGYKDDKDNVVGIGSWLGETTYKKLPHLHSLERLAKYDFDTDKYFWELAEILEAVSVTHFINSLINNSKYVIDSNKTIEALKWLSANHFNIYNLPKEMYIEKSDSINEKNQLPEIPTVVKTKKGKIGDYVEIWSLGGLAAKIDKITVDGYILTNEDGVVDGYFGDDDLAINPYGEE
jgi:hypothetical protein